jgi:hypothetical protein
MAIGTIGTLPHFRGGALPHNDVTNRRTNAGNRPVSCRVVQDSVPKRQRLKSRPAGGTYWFSLMDKAGQSVPDSGETVLTWCLGGKTE